MSSYVPRPASAPSQHSAQTNPFEFAREHTIRDDWALRLDPETDTPDRLRAGAFAIMSEGFGIKDPTGRVFSGAQQNALDPKEYFAKARACWDAGSLAPVQSEGWNAYHDAAEKGDRATMRRLARENIRGEDAGDDFVSWIDRNDNFDGRSDQDWGERNKRMKAEFDSIRDAMSEEDIAEIDAFFGPDGLGTKRDEFFKSERSHYEARRALESEIARKEAAGVDTWREAQELERLDAEYAGRLHGAAAGEDDAEKALSRVEAIRRKYHDVLRDEQRLPAYERQLADENLWATVQGLRGAVSDDAWRVVEMAQQSAGSPTQKRVLDAFGKLTTTEQRSIAGVLHALHYGRDTTLVGDAFRSFWDTAAQTVGGSARAIADVFRRGVMDGEEYRDMVERRALLEQANSGRMKEWGYFGQSVVGAFSTIPYMAVAAIPYAGTAAIMASASDQFQTEAALNGVDVGSREFMLTNWAFSGAYAAVEKLQIVPFKPLKNVSRRQMYCEMFHSLRSALFVAGGVAGTTVSESVEEGIQGGIERVVEGWGLGHDQAKEFAAGFASDFVGSLGTMAIIGTGAAGVQKHRYRHGAFSPEGAISATARVADLESRIKGHPENAAVPLGEFSREFGMLGRDWVNAGTDGTARVRALMRWGFTPEQATRLHGMFSEIWKGVSGDEDARSAFVGGNRVRSAAELLADTLGVQVEDGENGEKSVSFRIGQGRVKLRFNPADRIETAVDVNDRTQAADVVEILNRNEEAATGTRGTMTVDEWLALPEEVRREQTKGMTVQGGFKIDAPDGTSVGEDALRVLSGRVIETDVALPQTVFHESMHAVLRLLREEAAADPEARALQEELAKVYAPQEGIDEAVNEEALADGYQTYLTSLTTAVEDTGVFARLKRWIARLLGRATVARDSLRAAQSAQGRLFNLALTGDISPALEKEEGAKPEPEGTKQGEEGAKPAENPAPAEPASPSPAKQRLAELEAELAATPREEIAKRQRLENRIAEQRKKVEREGGGTRASISGIYTGSAADYANRVPVLDKDGNVTGYRIDNAPSLKHVGTGEGSQVYGWGLYGSNVRGVAEGYAKQSETNPEILDQQNRSAFDPTGDAVADEARKFLATMYLAGADSVDKAVDMAVSRLRDAKKQAQADWLQEHRSEFRIGRRRNAVIYEQTFFTNRAPGDESHLLKWYEPVPKEQMEWIKSAFEKEKAAGNHIWGVSDVLGTRRKLTGGEIYKYIAEHNGSEGPRIASEFLARAGIDGVKYPVDSFGGKGVKDGDKVGWNYVSFRDDNIRVDHKWVDGEQRFSMSSAVERTPDLVAFHNASASGLKGMDELGGLAMPSFAVTKDSIGGNEFGEITLLVRPDVIDPTDRTNRIFSNDAWTPTFPSVRLRAVPKMVERAQNRFRDIFTKKADGPWKGFADGWSSVTGDAEYFDDLLNRFDDIEAALRGRDVFKAAFLVDTGRAFPLPTREEEVFRSGFGAGFLVYADNKAVAAISQSPLGDRLVPNGEAVNYQEAEELVKDEDFLKSLQQTVLENSASFEAIGERFRGLELAKWAKTKPELAGYKLRDLADAVDYWRRNGGAGQTLDRGAATKAVDEAIEKNRAAYDAWIKEFAAGLTDGKRYIRNDKDVYTPSGNRRPFEKLYDPLTLAAAVRAMLKQQNDQGNGFLGRNPFGVAAKEFKSLEAVIKDEDRLKKLPAEEVKKLKEALTARLSELVIEYEKTQASPDENPFTAHSRAADMMMDAYAAAKGNKARLSRELNGWGYRASEEFVDAFLDVMNDMASMPEDYFEAKAYRAVHFDEIAEALVPDNADAETIDILRRRGVPFRTYKAGDNSDRLRALNEAATERKARFSITPAEDAAYLDAVRRGDMETAQHMVDNAFDESEGYRDEDGQFHHRKHVHAVGYRIGRVPDGGRSYNTRDGRYEEGVSLIGVGNLPPVRSFAIAALRDAGAKVVYLEGDVLTKTGGDDEFLMTNAKPITKDAFDRALRTDAQKIAEKTLADKRWDTLALFGADKGAIMKWANAAKGITLAPVTYDDAGNVIPLSQRFNPAKEDIRYQISGAVGAEALGIRGLADAEAMERSGADRTAIWRETGWWRGRDGEWRVEIPDFELSDRLLGRAEDVIEQRRLWNVVDVARKAVSDAEREYMQWANKAGPFRPNSPEWEKDKKLIRGIERLRAAQSKAEKAYRLFHDKSLGLALAEGRAVTLSDIIKPDSALANAYPSIGEIRVYANQPLSSGVAGQWNGHSIELAPELLRGDMERLRSVLAHEVQHVIQTIEGFARGGDETLFRENVLDAEEIRRKMFSPELSEEEYERLRRRLEEIEENALDGSVEVDGDVYEDEFDAYRSLAGEADARLVQKRLNMTPEERAARPPWEDYDVDEDRQIVRFSVGLVAEGLRRGREAPGLPGSVQVGAARAGAERAADSLSRTVNETLSAAGEAYRASVAWNGPAYSYKSFATAYAARDRILGIDRPDDDYRRLLETMGVRDYSVDDLKADAEKIRARGLGRNEATLQRLAGLAEQASMARTVESLMRGSLELGEDVGSSARRAYETYLARMRRTAKGRDYSDLTADLGFDLADLALAIDPEAFAPQPKPEGDAAPPAGGSDAETGAVADEDPEVAALLDGKAADFGLTEEQLRERIRERMEQRTQEIRERLGRIRARLDEWRAKEARRKAKLAERQEAEGKSDAPADLQDAEMFDEEQNETEAGAKRLADYESECVEEMPDFKAFLEECRRNGLDLSDAAEFVAAVRIWSEDFIARETGADPEKVLRDPVNLARYRATMMEFLHGMADAMLDPEDGAAAKTAERMMQEIPSDATVGEIDGRARTVVGFIQRNGIRQTRKQLIRELRKGIKLEAIRGKKWDEMERDAGRKVTGEREAAARYLYRILTWSDGMIAKESARLHDIVAGREDAYRSAGADDAALKDLARTDREVHRAAEKLQALQMYGGLRKKSPAEIKLAARAIMSWLTEEREAHEKRWNDWHARLDALAERAAKAASASAQDYTPEDPGYVGKLADELTATIRQRLEQLFVGGGADARAVIDEVMRLVYAGSERMRAETAAARRRTDEMLERCVQGTGRNVRQFLKDLDAPIPEELNRQLRTAEQPVRMTNGQALQLLASLEQVASYAGNIEANGRGAERVVGTDPDGNPITEPQTPHAELLRRYFADKPAMVRLLEGMREVYEERRGALSDTFRAVTGNPILAPDPLYAPVKMFRGSSEGFETQVRAWDPFGPALQPRIKNTLDFDLSASIMDVYNNRTRETCRAIAWGIPGMELRSVLCRKEVQDAIARTHGKFPLRQLVAHLTDLVSDGWADEPSGFKWIAQKLGGATTYSALSWNVVTALKQTTSIPAWTALMDGGYAEVFRHIANFDRAACRELMAAPGFAARYGADSFAQMFKDAIRDPNANPLQRFFQAGMTAVQMGDFVPGILVGTGVYKAKKLALMRQGLEERQAREEAARIAWGLIEECQQSSRLENSPAFLRRGGFLARQAAKFASSPLLQVSHEVHTLRMWIAEAKAEARRNGGGVRMMSDSEDVARWRRRFVNQLICNHVLMPVAMYGIATMFNIALGSEPPDEEEVLGDVVMQMISGPFGRVFLLGMIFDKGGETVARAMGGKPNVYDSTGLAAQQYLQKLFGQIGRICGDVADADWESVRDDLLKMLGQVSAPARYAIKIGQNAAGYDPAEARRERKAEIRRERGE